MNAQQIFNGITIGMSYALIAVGYSLVFGILRLVNFSHGSVYAFGANIILYLISKNIGIIPAILLGIVFTGALGILIDKTSLEPLRKAKSEPIASLITTIGISNIISNLLIASFGSQKRQFPALFPSKTIQFLGIDIQYTQLGMFAVSLILMLLLVALVNKTNIGLAMRASQQNIKAAQLMGINVNFIISFTFFLGGVSAAIAGSLVSSYYSMAYPNMGYMAGLKAFAAAVLGGIGSLQGSLVGGLLVGLSESFAATYLGSEYRDSMAFIILIIVLIIRPNGLFGKKGVEKV
ncbi:branched-chain amino acid transport system permease protein [Peptoniphilus koenoeneniae]|uniref:Branched-chain amino acid transport system permease protein n=1 Tax=Peptoniphilus koenoeneniae TaxID=507751 RepID=A0ABU0AVA9_9FIRM|nr:MULTISPECIES: branched-chain amino acid ABC transporter permease [Peptoniphilus]ERT60170.1 branched-chain amino acid ABC transporter, permease protein [Peptoniphilus sp. BV3C26]MDQ0274383.1 branched-chain amino acid transport system permease protein [Peptoniphilus koenoeneniae]